MNGASLDPAARRKRRRRIRFFVYGFLIAIGYGFFIYQPICIDLVERRPHPPLPLVDPDTARLFAPHTSVLLVTAHPDDSEYYLGGTLLKLGKTADIHQVICTDGDKAFYWIFTNVAENRRVRHAEATAANQAWHGASLDYLGYPDGRLRNTQELQNKIADAIRRYKPQYILCFDPDYPPRVSHSDHRRAGEATIAAAKAAGIGAWVMMFSTNGDNYVDDVDSVWDARLQLLAIHKSQWTGKKLDIISDTIENLAVDDAERINATYGEGFRCVRVSDLR